MCLVYSPLFGFLDSGNDADVSEGDGVVVEDIDDDGTCCPKTGDGDDSMDEDAELLIAVASCGGEWWVMVFSGDLGSDFLGLMLTGGERLME